MDMQVEDYIVGDGRRGTVVSGSYSGRGHSLVSHFFSEGDVSIRVGEVVWTIQVSVVDIKAATFRAFPEVHICWVAI